MIEWTDKLCNDYILDYNKLDANQQSHLKGYLNKNFPFEIYEQHKRMRHSASENEKGFRDELKSAKKYFPDLIYPENEYKGNITKRAIVLTAGGEGERLRLSLEKMGYGNDVLNNFTKATFPLPDFYEDFGTLDINLTLIAYLEKKHDIDLPVIVTTGPQGSTTAEIIPGLVGRRNNFGLSHILVIQQQERLHLTQDDKVAWFLKNSMPFPVTHPDETGGPLMSLKRENNEGVVPLKWLGELEVERILVLQATALYNPDMIFAMANTGGQYDCVGVGILRESFIEDDPYGTYVAIENEGHRKVVIVEQNVRDKDMEKLRDSDEKYYLPYNTGFYTFKKDLLINASLPDFATPPKEILPHIERSPKVGYAATDLIKLAEKPAVMVVPEGWYRVLKNADNLVELSSMGKRYKLDRICKDYSTH
jgi:hypothetical protein